MKIFPAGTAGIKVAQTFWGKAGSGMLYVCLEDQTALLLHRGPEVEQSGTWGIPGGAVAGTEGHYKNNGEVHEVAEDQSRASAEREATEELGTPVTSVKDLGTTTFQSGSFRYLTYIVAVTPAEKERLNHSVQLNWENDDYDWFPLDRLPQPLHFGVEHTFSQLDPNIFK